MTDKTSHGSYRQQAAGLAPAEIRALALATEQQVNDAPEPAAGAAIPGLAAGDDSVGDAVRRLAAGLPSRPLVVVLDERHSAVDMGTFHVHELVALLARAYRVRDVLYASDEEDGAWTSRPVPSAGARHPFELLVSIAAVNGAEPGRYVFDAHRVGLPLLDPAWLPYVREVEHSALRASRKPEPAPATIVLLANVDRVADKYSAALTLLMRDAGVLLQTLHLVATDLGLASRILGSAGQLTYAESSGHLVVDCGALIVGSMRPVP